MTTLVEAFGLEISFPQWPPLIHWYGVTLGLEVICRRWLSNCCPPCIGIEINSSLVLEKSKRWRCIIFQIHPLVHQIIVVSSATRPRRLWMLIIMSQLSCGHPPPASWESLGPSNRWEAAWIQTGTMSLSEWMDSQQQNWKFAATCIDALVTYKWLQMAPALRTSHRYT